MLWWKYSKSRYADEFEKCATEDCKFLFPTFSDKLKCNSNLIYQDRSVFKDYAGKKILLIGGGDSTNNMDWDKLEDYDYVWSVNHFFLHPVLKDKKVDLIYVQPDTELLTGTPMLIENTTFGVLQEYVRSGLLDRMYIVKNSLVESVLGSVSIANYWQEINQVISSTYHMLNVFENTEPLLSTVTDDKDTIKICTMGVVAFSSFDEKTFYDLENARSKKYFFGISQKTLDEEKDLRTSRESAKVQITLQKALQ